MRTERDPSTASAVAPAVKASNLSVKLGEQVVLENVSFEIEPASFVGIVGPNGAGKTTLLRVMLGLVREIDGELLVFGKPPADLGAKRHTIGYVPQRPAFDRRFPISAMDVVLMGRVSCRGIGRRLDASDRDAAARSLERVGGAHLAHRPIGELSGGEQQRVFLARALCNHTRLLLLDEPNTGLDLPSQVQFFDLLADLRRDEGLTVAVVSHDLSMISRYADRLFCINRRMHIHGSPSEVLDSPKLDEAYACEYDRFVLSHDRRREP